jgi:hypothetical protein
MKTLITTLALAGLAATSAVAKTETSAVAQTEAPVVAKVEKIHLTYFGRQSSQRIGLILGISY